ncbi:MAG: hypothetical protein AAFX10_14400 [Pseudomonadota bacterium]
MRDDKGRLTGEKRQVGDNERVVMRMHPDLEDDENLSFTPDTAPTAPDLSEQ